MKDKKLKGTLAKIQKNAQEAAKKAASYEILLTEEPGYLEVEGLEKTYKVKQKDILNNVFNINLPTFGPYTIDYTRNGRYLLMGGRKGHIATLDWQGWKTEKYKCEFHVKETVRDVKWLHNEQYFAVAQKKYVYIYDQNGLELHKLKNHIEVNRLEFLPFHFLLATVGNAGYLKYQDTSTGKLVAELKTKLGKCDAMCQNPWNAIINLGHANGTVTLWSPNMSTPLVRILTHKGPVVSLAVDNTGRYMATSGLDGQLKLWDVRTYKPLQQYFCRTPASSLSISQLGLLSVGWGPHIYVWKNAFLEKQKSPYMTHIQEGSQIQDVHFCPFEDVLGFGYCNGVSSIVIPGSGEPNIDSLAINPFQTKKQRQESEVHSLLDKIQPEMIILDPNFVAKVDKVSKEIVEKERKEEEEREAKNNVRDKSSNSVRKKTRHRSSLLKRYLRKKQKNVIDERKQRARTALDRFSSKKRKSGT
ncbi:10399_t:CDS:10 [Entrophospora sp. SA101]|nr:10399_t:CDS:10 [Entrophospora sp. SA101]